MKLVWLRRLASFLVWLKLLKRSWVLGLLLATGPSWGQQNLFNIPAGDLTPKNKFFFQHQSNIYSHTSFEAKNHLVYGLGKGWEVGLNVVNVKFNLARNAEQAVYVNNDDHAQPLQPLAQLTGAKFFRLGPKWHTVLGTQLGSNPVRLGRQDRRLTHFSYNIWVFEPRSHLKFVAGPYLTDWASVGSGNRAGLLLGFEAPLAKKWLLMGDFISGRHTAAVSVLGFNYLASNRVQLCLGALVPNPSTRNSAGAVFELNLLGWTDADEAPPTTH